jgi:protein TonB
LSQGLLLKKVAPSYPEKALKAGLQGAVVLQAWIDRDGSIRDLKLVDGSLLLGQAAVKAVKQWRYKPYVRNGVAVEAETYITVNFRLP